MQKNKTVIEFNYNYSVGLYFYKRSDSTEILRQLSPWRSKLEKSVPYFHYLGLITNLICILIFSRKNLIKRKSIFLLVILAFADFMYNFLSVLPNFLMSNEIIDYNIYKTSDFSCFMYDFGITSFHFYSVLLTLLITAERYEHISRPLNLDSKLHNIKCKKRIGFCLYFVSMLISLPHGFLMIYNKKENDCDARKFFRQTIFNTNITYYQLYFTFTEPVLIWFIPGISIMVMNFYVIYKIFKSNEIYSKQFTVSFMPLKRSKLRKSATQKSISHSSVKHDLVHQANQDILHLQSSSSKENTNELIKLAIRDASFDKITVVYKKEKNILDLPDLTRSIGSRAFVKCKELNSKFAQSFEINDDNSYCKNYAEKNTKTLKLSVNQVSHYLTIVIVGFYFILSTIPYGIILTFQNNLTLKLNYLLETKNDYLNDQLWIKYGFYRELVIVFRIFFMSNHCLNFFLYFLFNRLFRNSLFKIFRKAFNMIKELCFSKKSVSFV